MPEHSSPPLAARGPTLAGVHALLKTCVLNLCVRFGEAVHRNSRNRILESRETVGTPKTHETVDTVDIVERLKLVILLETHFRVSQVSQLSPVSQLPHLRDCVLSIPALFQRSGPV